MRKKENVENKKRKKYSAKVGNNCRKKENHEEKDERKVESMEESYISIGRKKERKKKERKV